MAHKDVRLENADIEITVLCDSQFLAFVSIGPLKVKIKQLLINLNRLLY